MGGSIRKEIEFKVTHLIANCCGGEKYKDANMFKVPIMSMAWITTLWQGRDDPTIYGHNEQLVSWITRLFYFLSITFLIVFI